MIRSLRALILFWTLFASHGLTWMLANISGKERASRLFERAHKKNARRLTRGFTELGGVFIKMGQVLGVTGTFLPPAYGEALEAMLARETDYGTNARTSSTADHSRRRCHRRLGRACRNAPPPCGGARSAI